MVRFLSKPAIEEQHHHSNNQPSSSPSKDNNTLVGDQTNLLLDVSFADSLLNYDFIKDFFEDTMEPDTASLENVDVREFANVLCRDISVPSAEVIDGPDLGCLSTEGVMVKEEDLELQSGLDLGGSIEEDMGRVSLVSNGNGDETGDAKGEVQIKEEEMENGVNNVATNGGEADSDSDGQSSSSSSGDSSPSDSSSSDADDDGDEEEEEEEEEEIEEKDEKDTAVELKVEEEVCGDDVEEGEIRDEGDNLLGRNDDGDEEEEDEDDVTDEVSKMVEWSDADEEEDVGVEKSPIRSKNELKALPPVPPVDAVLLPHHEMQPVGLVSSVLGTQVIVEGVEKHNPLNEGSIIWLTEKRSPLGLVDEIFGPVKNPFYIVRFNSESEVPEGLSEGTLVSFVPEFAGFVLSNQNLYKKGYDASGENDEELSEEIEFSDDEKEAEYRRMKKMVKRGMNGQTTVGNKKRNKKKADNWKNNDNNPSWQQQHSASPHQHDRTDPNQQQPPPNSCHQVETNPRQQNHPLNVNQQHNNASPVQPSAVMGQGINGGNPTPFIPPFRPMLQQQQQNPGFFPPPNGNWPNGGLFPQHQQNPAAPPQFGGFQNPLQMQIQSLMQQLQQQLNPGNVMLPNGQPNFFQAPGFMPWPAAAAGAGMMNQGSSFNQPPRPFGMNFLPQPTANQTMMNNSMNNGEQPSANAQSPQQQAGGMMNQGSSFNQPPRPFGMNFLPQPTANQTMMNNSMNNGEQPSANAQSPQQQAGNGVPPRNFNAGGSNRGRRPFRGRGGGGRFRGRGGR
ncbi:H/ACA ribonucleoprotein complex non-core subunit NAF1 [Linum grandiflorum]